MFFKPHLQLLSGAEIPPMLMFHLPLFILYRPCILSVEKCFCGEICLIDYSYSARSKRSLEKKEEPVPSPSLSGLQRTPKAEHPSRKRTVSQSSTSLSSGTGSGKEGSHGTKGNSTSKHRKGEDKGRSTREGKVGASNQRLSRLLPE